VNIHSFDPSSGDMQAEQTSVRMTASTLPGVGSDILALVQVYVFRLIDVASLNIRWVFTI
jgi:hypothetical protein